MGSATSNVNANYMGMRVKNVKASFIGSYRITTSEFLPQSLTWTLVGQERMSAGASANVFVSGATAQSLGASVGEKGIGQIQTPVLSATNTGGIELWLNPTLVKKRTVKLHDLIWSANPNGSGKSCVAKIQLGLIGGLAKLKGPGSFANYDAADASGSAGYSYYVTGIKSSGGGGVLTVSIPPGRQGVGINIYNSSGNLVDEWTCDADGGTAELYIDDYASGQYVLAFQANGTLVTKMTLSIDPAVSQTVNPVWKYGDLDGDNFVSQAEVDFVQAHIGTTLSSSVVADEKFPTLDSPYVLSRADLNGDGQITQADVTLAQASLGLHGD